MLRGFIALRLAAVVAVVFAFGTGCRGKGSSSPPPAYGQGYGYGQPGYGSAPPPGYPPPGPGYGQPYPQQPYPGSQPGSPPPGAPAPAPAPAPLPGPNPAAALDPINNVDINWLRNQAGVVMGELIAALPPGPRSRVENIPFLADPTVGEVNAFAACDDQGKPLMAITDGLLEIEAHLAQFKATDEIFGTKKLDAYIHHVAKNQKPGMPIVRPPVGFVDPLQHVDGRKVARQHEVFDEQLAFVLGHELGHHHLGHLGCSAPGGTSASPAMLGNLLARAVPAFNQPNEIAADVAGTNNLLEAGKRRQGYRWTEGGALLTLQFFAGLDQLTPATVVFGFERTHPHPLVRRPIVENAARTWRATGGGIAFPFPGFGG